MSDLYFAWCDGEDTDQSSSQRVSPQASPMTGSVRDGSEKEREARRARGWHLLYPATEDGEDDLYIGPYATFAAAYLASLEERP